MRRPADQKQLVVGLGLAFGVLVFVAFLFLGTADQESKNAAWVLHTRDVLNKIDELVNALVNAETGRRGYILSGDERYAAHFTNQVQQAYLSLRQLRGLTRDNPAQTQACDRLEPLVAQRLMISTNSLHARRERGLDTAAQAAYMEQGQQAMELIRQAAAKMAARETPLLKKRLEVQEQNIQHTEGFAVLLGFFALGMFGGLFALYWRADARRRRVEQALDRTNLELEQRVRERTTELSQSQERLAQERNLLRTVIDNLPAYIYLKDVEGRFVVNNLANARAMNAATEADTLGKTVFDFLPDATARVYDNEDRQVLSTGEPVINREVQAGNADGQQLWRLTTKVPLRDPQGTLTGLLGISQDITQSKEAEQKLRAQLARLDLLSRTTRAIGERQDLASIFQVVLQSLEDNLPIDFGCVCLYEPNTMRLAVANVGSKSHPVAERLAMGPQTHIAIDENGLSRCILGELVYEPDITRTEFPFPHRLASAGLGSLVIAPLLVESQVFGILVASRRQPGSFSSGDCEFLRQLSEHVALAAHQAQLYGALQQAYEDLRRTQQAVAQQERLRALGQMASGIAHDINNALSPVAIYSEVLLEREPNLSARARQHLQTISTAIDDVTETVARMREFYRQREPQLVLGPVQLNDCVNQVLNLTRARWSDMPQQRGVVIQVKTELAPDLPAIPGVESEIRDALTNLVLNAVDAMPEGGTLTLRTRVLQPAPSGLGPPNPLVCVEVVDTGVGMNEETQRRCLEPFFTTKGERGTGLGLAMVYGMTRRHNAELEVESAPGQGSTMRLVFALRQEKSVGPDPADPLRASPKRLRILVVDDDPMLLKAVCDALEADGHLVVTAAGGQAGIEAFSARCKSAEPFDVAITDLGMPYIDGRRVAAAIKGLSPSTPVILLTGWGRRLMREGGVPENVDQVLSKPPKIAELRDALARCAGGGSPGP